MKTKVSMALPYRFTGVVNSRSKGVIDAINKQLQFINLKPAKRITFSYNPFHEKVLSIRRISQFLFKDSIRETNLKCSYRTTVHNNIEEPLLTVNLESGKSIIFKTSNLTELEILQKFNALITSAVKEE